jgi:hypothetical protein
VSVPLQCIAAEQPYNVAPTNHDKFQMGAGSTQLRRTNHKPYFDILAVTLALALFGRQPPESQGNF